MAAADGYVIASAFLQSICRRAAESAGAGGRDLRRVLKALFQIQSVLEAAEEKQWEDKQAREWLRGLKHAAYDLDDLLDSLPGATSESDDGGDEDGGDRAWTASRCFFFILRALSRPNIRPLLKDLSSIRERIEGLQEGGRCKFHPPPDLDRSRRIDPSLPSLAELVRMEDHGGSFSVSRDSMADEKISTSILRSSPPGPMAGPVGIDSAKDAVVKMLIPEEESSHEASNLAVVSIVGGGGVGKTTLARLVYNDIRVSSHFDLRLWIDAHEVFDTGELFRSMLQKTGGGGAGAGEAAEEMVVECLYEKRFFLVLDDPWHEKIKWWNVRKYLEVGGKGSRVVIVTGDETRMAKAMGEAAVFHVRGLSSEDCWELLKRYAFGDAMDSSRELMKEMELAGKTIAARMGGLPLSVKMIGSLLRHYPPEPQHWDMVKNDKLWWLRPRDVVEAAAGIPPALWISYSFLPPCVKQCLAYCSVFSKHHEYERDAMIQMWVAQGFIQPSENGVLLEDEGDAVFSYLANRSFLQSFDGGNGGGENKYLMCSHVHQLSMCLTQGETLQLGVGNDASITAVTKPRHLLLFSDHLKEGFAFDPSRFEGVRTLVFYGLTMPRFDFDSFLAKLRCLRVLCLNAAPFVRELPNPIREMKQLRYLDLRFTAIRRLPEEACSLLSKLQTLKLHKDATLPKGLWKLANLRHLEADTDKKSQIYQVGKLALLQELKKMVVLDENGYRIDELKDLTELRGELMILGLENASGNEAIRANLGNKRHLQKLELEWSRHRVFSRPEPNWDAVLECLRPHHGLQRLTIRNHLGSRFPSWLGNQWLSKLESIEIYDCHHWALPPLGKLPNLKSLVVEFGYRAPLDSRGSMPNMKCAGLEFYGDGPVSFPELENLRISGIKEWEEWEAVEDGKLFPKLTTLVVDNCMYMKGLPSLPQTLRELDLRNAGVMELPGIQGCRSASTLALSSLYISCWRLTSLEGLLQHKLTALKSLTISGCEKVTSLPKKGLSDLVSLETLEISMCLKMSFSSEATARTLPSSLLQLIIHRCPSLTNDSFFICLEELCSLTTLHVGGADESLRFLPGERLRHLSSLTELKVEGCEGLRSLGFMALISLKRLEISGCPNLVSTCSPVDLPWIPLEYLRIKSCPLHILASHLLRSLAKLQELTIDGCSGETFLEESEQELLHLASLHRLAITRCFELQSLPRELGSIPCLEELCIIACPEVRSLPEKPLPATLAMFSIDDCPDLVERCKEKREDWRKIEHVPTKYLNFTKNDGMVLGAYDGLGHLDRKWIPGMKNGSS